MEIFGVIIQISFFAVATYGISYLLSTSGILALNWTEKLSLILDMRLSSIFTIFAIFAPYYISICFLFNTIEEGIIDDLIPGYKSIGYTALAEIFIICAAAGLRM